MTEQRIIEIFADGDVHSAIKLAQDHGYASLVTNFQKSISLLEDPALYKAHYQQNNGRVPGLQITDKWGFDLRQQKAMEHVKALGGSGLLDVGCADGSFIFMCLAEGIIDKAVGIDPWEAGIEWAQKHAAENLLDDKAQFICGLLEEQSELLPCSMIHVGEVLEHVIDPITLIQKAMSLCSSLKGIVITVPVARPPVTAEEITILTSGNPAEHVRSLGEKVIKNYCDQLGLTMSCSDTVGGGWANLVCTLKKE